jgi:hypothetical protein
MRLLTTLIVFTIYLTTAGQSYPTKKEGWFQVDTLFAENGTQKKRPNYSYEWMDSEVKYSDATEKSIIIQNSLPRGSPGYTDPTGRRFGFAIFWTRIINETSKPIEVSINFSADSFAIFSSPDSYLKFFLPPDTMTPEKERFVDYGVRRSFLDSSINKSSELKRTINPKKECLFYIVLLPHVSDNGAIRAGLVLKDQRLFYRTSIAWQLDSTLIPCGQIVFKK